MTDQDFERAVQAHYADVFRFALSLSKQEAEAADLTQESFYLLGSKGRRVSDPSKIKSWLFTTCYREFLRRERNRLRIPQVELSLVEEELPDLTPDRISQLDAAAVIDALRQLDEIYRVPVTLFYLRGESYKEIASILDVPIGTVMSRLARGKDQLRNLLARSNPTAVPAANRNIEPNLSEQVYD
jgi:RNA polymerase sigma-70 factor (ECF subfamily)